MVIFSGIQPTGRKHLGNYIGAILQYVEGQDRADPAIYCIVDLHGTTVAYEPAELRERSRDTAALLVAAGLDPERCVLFRQSDVPEHTELTWLLSSVTSVGQLNRMHQFRDKAGAARERASAGLLYYPVLMAADVLAYRAHEVPVGEDQREHIELMRDVAEAFNKRFGETLVVPEGNIPTVGARIRDLKEPDKKMSTTGGTRGGPDLRRRGAREHHQEVQARGDRLRARDRARRRQARHHEHDRDPRRSCAGTAPSAIEHDFEGKGYGDFKTAVGEEVAEWLRADARALPRAARGHGGDRGRSSSWAPRRRPRSRPAWSPTCARRWASASPSEAPPSLPGVRIAQLELDLDVFAGPFDLLLSLILREELDLLEVDLAEVVIAYLDHLESLDELDLESATEFLVLIAALLELKSRLMLPGEEVEELDELAPAEAAEELVERMLQYIRFRGAGTHLAERHDHGVGFLYRCAPLPPEFRKVSAGGRREGLRRRRPGRLAGRAAARAGADRPLAHGDAARHGRRPPAGPARPPAPRHLQLRRRGQGRRPRHGLRDRLRAARALQARRGRVGAGRAVRPDHGRPPTRPQRAAA